MIKLKTIFLFIRLVLKLGSCILYIAQTIRDENKLESDYIYPNWCCQNTHILPMNGISISAVLNKAVSQNNLCPDSYSYSYTLLNDTFPEYSSYRQWHTPGFCRALILPDPSCNCTFLCGTHHICGIIAHVPNPNNTQLLCKFDEATLDRSFYFLLKFILYPKSERIWIVQSVFGIMDMLGAIINIGILYYSNRKWVNFLEFNNLMDIAQGLMFIATISFPPCLKNIYIPTFLQSIQCVSIISLLVLEVDTFTTHRRWFTYNVQKSISVIFNVFAFIFVGTCAIEYIERVRAGDRDDSQPKNLPEAFYLLLITITTVGYGDFSPGTWFGRVLIIVIISAVLLYLPGIIEEMLETVKESGTHSKSIHGLYLSKYIVVCLSNPRFHFLFDFLSEVYADDSSKLGTVILSPRACDRIIETRLKSPVWQKRVLLLTGSALKSVDLERAGIKKCTACFVISDRHSYDPDASDQETILRAHSIHSFAPACDIYIYLLKVENKPLVSFARNIVCEGELKHAIFAASCMCPGFSTYISLLLHTTSSSPVGENALYNYCSGNEIYDIVLRDSSLLQDMISQDFLNAALFIHKKYGVLIIAIQKHKSKDILLNPGDKVKLEPEDRIFYISQTNEENKKGMKEMLRENDSIQRISAAQNIFRFNMSLDEESRETCDTSGTSPTTTSPTTSTSDMGYSNTNVFDSNMGKRGKVHSDGQATVRTSDYSVKQKAGRQLRLGAFTFKGQTERLEIPDLKRDFSPGQNKVAPYPKLQRTQRIIEDDMISDRSMISSQKEISHFGIPKQSLFMLPTGNAYHITKPSKLCCLQVGWKYTCHEEVRGIPVARKLNPPFEQTLYLYHHTFNDAIIVIADEAGPQLYNFILPLRAAHIATKDLDPIVLLLTSNPHYQFLEAISFFPQIRFMVGNPNNVEELLIAGMISAKLVILCLGDGTPTEKEEQHMTDATKIQTFLKLQQLFPRTRFLVEIFHRSNMEILCSKRNKSTNLNGFLTTPHFMSGQVFSPSLLDTILYQSAEKHYIIRLVRIMLGLEQGAGNRSLTSINRNVPELKNLQSYGGIMSRIAKEWGMLAIGIYRCEYLGKKDTDILEEYERNIAPYIRDKLFCMKHSHTRGRGVEKGNYAYQVLVNPIASISVHERDVILAINSTGDIPDADTSEEIYEQYLRSNTSPQLSVSHEVIRDSFELTEVVEENQIVNGEMTN